MKTKSYLAIILMVLACCFMECTESDRSKPDRQNGWYYFTESEQDSLSVEPILTVKEFKDLRLEDIQIVGSFTSEGTEKWADATENSVGKKLGFVYQGKVICAPVVNTRIEGGIFTISIHPSLNEQVHITDVYNGLRKEMKEENK